jgi:hypothetical protein
VPTLATRSTTVRTGCACRHDHRRGYWWIRRVDPGEMIINLLPHA